MTEGNNVITPTQPPGEVPERLNVQLRAGDPYLPVAIIGGQGGNAFNIREGDSGSILQKIWVWVGPSMIKAVRLWFTNGKDVQFGNPSGPVKEFVFQSGELIQSMSLWGNGAGTRLGAIKFITDKNREFFPKMAEWGLKQEYPIDVGSGICVGVMGRAGSDIDSMGFIFVKPISESVMTDMVYPTLGLVGPQVSPRQVTSVPYHNNLSVPQEFKLTAEDTLVSKEFWSFTAGVEFAYSVKVKAGIPELFEAETGYSFKVSASGTYGQENVKSKSEKWEFPIKVPANQSIIATVSIGRVDISMPYEAKVRITTTDKSQLEFNVSGVYEGVTYTQVTVSLKQIT
jgi:hypothetical protein